MRDTGHEGTRPARKSKNSQEQVNKHWNRKGELKNSAWIERMWGSKYKETSGWISTRTPGEVASASL